MLQRRPTWHAGDANHVGVAGVEAVQQVRRLTGVQHHDLGGGVGAGAHPHPAGRLVLEHQLLLLLPFLLSLATSPEEERGETSASTGNNLHLLLVSLLLTLPSESRLSRLLWEPLTCLESSDLPPDMLTPAAHHSCRKKGKIILIWT